VRKEVDTSDEVGGRRLMATTLFISYRRSDTAGWAGSLFRELTSLMGPDATIFMDVDGIPPGEDFAKYIDQSVGRCDALIALIGRQWVGALEGGARRIDDPNDFVRLEIAAALQRGIRVIPIQVDAAKLPSREELPDVLQPLRDRQAVEVDNTTWAPAIARLVGSFDTNRPRLVVSPSRLDFGVFGLNDPWPRRTVQLRNAGGGDLRASAASPQSWLIVHNRGDALDVLVDTSHEGEYTGELNVQSAGGRMQIEVTAEIRAARFEQEAPQPPPSTGATAQPPPSPAPPPPAWTTPAPPPYIPAQPPPGMAQRPPGMAQPPSGMAQPAPGMASTPLAKQPATYLIPAILSTVFCCIPSGIVAIVYATRVSTLYNAGNIQGALSASKNARLWSIISVGVGLVLGVIYLIAAASSNTSGY